LNAPNGLNAVNEPSALNELNGLNVTTSTDALPAAKCSPLTTPDGLTSKSNVGQLALLTLAHLTDDFYAGFLSPLLPLLQERLNLSLVMVGALPPIFSLAASGVQPFVGHMGDRVGSRRLVVLGVAFSSLFMSAIGLARGFLSLVVIILLGGAGISFFHPHGAAMVGKLSGRRRGLVMSFFLVAGSIGISVGPLFVVWLVSHVEFERSYVAGLPGVAIAVMLWLFLRDAPSLARGREAPVLRNLFTAEMRPILVLFLIVVVRSAVVIAFTNLIPLMLRARGEPLEAGARAIFVLLMFGSLGGMIGGFLSDRFSRTAILFLSSVLACPLFIGFLMAKGLAAYVLLALAGAVIQSAGPVAVVAGQEMKPEAASTVSGILMGFGWWFGSMPMPLLALLAERTSMAAALLVASSGCLLAGALAMALPKSVQGMRR
jgi:FSR family fosmidomycin resistance protein-like MFS transporter